MGQKLQDDKIGALSHSAGTITMQNSYLTLGGQQYESGIVNKALGSPSANTLYFLYAYYSSGVQLDLSTTVPSSYVASNPARKLVGALYTNGSSAFGSFVGLDGSPITDWMSYTPTGAWSTNTTYTGRWRRVGDTMEVAATASLSGSPNAASFTVSIPSGMSIDTTKTPNSWSNSYTNIGSASMQSAGTSYAAALVGVTNNTTLDVWAMRAGSGNGHDYTPTNATTPATFANGDFVVVVAKMPITGWAMTPIKDL